MKLSVHIERAALDAGEDQRFGREELAEAIRTELAVRLMAEGLPSRPHSSPLQHGQERTQPTRDVAKTIGAAVYRSLRQ